MSIVVPQGDFVILRLCQYLTLISKIRNITINRKAFSKNKTSFKAFTVSNLKRNIDFIKIQGTFVSIKIHN